MGNLIPLALAAAFYPTQVAVILVILLRPNPTRLLAGFLAGAVAASFVVGLAVLAAIESSGVVGSNSSHSISPTIDVIAGVLSLTLAFVIGSGRSLPFAARRAERKAAKSSVPKESWTSRMLARDSLAIAFGLGVLLDLPSVWYVAALKDIAAAGNSTAADIGLVLLFIAIMFILVEVALVFFLVAPERSAVAVARFDAWARSHLRQLGAAVATVIGTYLLINGVAGLV